ncbi:MAG TPA: serine hydrolase domain-containing protein [Acidimicrobiales bacterium]|nr:serine hydrolase domain-containing protein [Acidimicrobiales bacterium]
MGGLSAYRARLDGLLAELAGEHRVPGAACGVLLGGEQHVATTGVANVATGVPVTPDTLFQLGSLTKVYTASLVLQAQAAGVVSLDEPVRAQLQEFMVADPGATIEITPRHLLTHTSGIEGDHLIDTGWNPDALQRYVATLAGLGQIHATDEAYSFCNTGYAVVGRLLEVATGEHFDRVLRRRLTRPLGCPATLTLPQHALLHRVAVGHVQAPGAEPVRQSRWSLTRSNGPMGGVLAPAGEVLAFARLHLDEGRAATGGGDLLAPADVAAMQRPHVEAALPGEHQALGWTVRRWGDLTVLGQDADTFGQRAVLRVIPERDMALCVLTNSPPGGALAQELLGCLAGDLLDVPPGADPADLPAAPAALDPGPDLAAHPGVYERLHQRIVARRDRDGLVLATEPSGVLQALGVRGTDLPLSPVTAEGTVFSLTDPTGGTHEHAVFVGPPAAPPTGLYLAGRLHRRIA